MHIHYTTLLLTLGIFIGLPNLSLAHNLPNTNTQHTFKNDVDTTIKNSDKCIEQSNILEKSKNHKAVNHIWEIKYIDVDIALNNWTKNLKLATYLPTDLVLLIKKYYVYFEDENKYEYAVRKNKILILDTYIQGHSLFSIYKNPNDKTIWMQKMRVHTHQVAEYKLPFNSIKKYDEVALLHVEKNILLFKFKKFNFLSKKENRFQIIIVIKDDVSNKLIPYKVISTDFEEKMLCHLYPHYIVTHSLHSTRYGPNYHVRYDTENKTYTQITKHYLDKKNDKKAVIRLEEIMMFFSTFNKKHQMVYFCDFKHFFKTEIFYQNVENAKEQGVLLQSHEPLQYDEGFKISKDNNSLVLTYHNRKTKKWGIQWFNITNHGKEATLLFDTKTCLAMSDLNTVLYDKKMIPSNKFCIGSKDGSLIAFSRYEGKDIYIFDNKTKKIQIMKRTLSTPPALMGFIGTFSLLVNNAIFLLKSSKN